MGEFLCFFISGVVVSVRGDFQFTTACFTTPHFPSMMQMHKILESAIKPAQIVLDALNFKEDLKKASLLNYKEITLDELSALTGQTASEITLNHRERWDNAEKNEG